MLDSIAKYEVLFCKGIVFLFAISTLIIGTFSTLKLKCLKLPHVLLNKFSQITKGQLPLQAPQLSMSRFLGASLLMLKVRLKRRYLDL